MEDRSVHRTSRRPGWTSPWETARCTVRRGCVGSRAASGGLPSRGPGRGAFRGQSAAMARGDMVLHERESPVWRAAGGPVLAVVQARGRGQRPDARGALGTAALARAGRCSGAAVGQAVQGCERTVWKVGEVPSGRPLSRRRAAAGDGGPVPAGPFPVRPSLGPGSLGGWRRAHGGPFSGCAQRGGAGGGLGIWNAARGTEEGGGDGHRQCPQLGASSGSPRPPPAAEPQQHPPSPLGPPLQGPGRPRPHGPSRPLRFSSRTPAAGAALAPGPGAHGPRDVPRVPGTRVGFRHACGFPARVWVPEPPRPRGPGRARAPLSAAERPACREASMGSAHVTRPPLPSSPVIYAHFLRGHQSPEAGGAVPGQVGRGTRPAPCLAEQGGPVHGAPEARPAPGGLGWVSHPLRRGDRKCWEAPGVGSETRVPRTGRSCLWPGAGWCGGGGGGGTKASAGKAQHRGWTSDRLTIQPSDQG